MRAMTSIVVLLGPTLLAPSATISAFASTYHVPGDAPTIQAGIDLASAGDTVLVACGTYYEHDIMMKSGISLVSETGDADCATIDAQDQGRVLYCENVSESTLIKGFTMTDGGLGKGWGGGVYCGDHSSPRFESCTIRSNHAVEGGGMYCENNSSPTLTQVRFESNHADVIGLPSTGGGLVCVDSSSPKLTECTFVGNGGSDGAGMYCNWGSPRLTDCVFISNYGFTGYGSGMYCRHSSLVLERVVFDGNRVDGMGLGGTLVCAGGTATLTDVTFTDNGTYTNFPFATLHLESIEATLTRITLEGNAGGPAATFYGCSPTLRNGTFYGNECYDGVLLCAGSASPTLEQTIIAFNSQGPAINCGDGQPVLECCDIFGNEGGDWVGCIEDQYGINGNISEDPLFCDPENGDLTLHVDSPCAPFSPPNEECDLIGAWRVACGTTSADEQEVLPTAMHLATSVPNPCSPSTRITYMIPAGTDTSPVLLRIYDLAGRVVRTLTEATQPPGVYTATWDGTNQSGTPVAGGVYFYQLKVNGEIQTRRMTLVR